MLIIAVLVFSYWVAYRLTKSRYVLAQMLFFLAVLFVAGAGLSASATKLMGNYVSLPFAEVRGICLMISSGYLLYVSHKKDK